MQCVKPKSLIKRHCEVCDAPISSKIWNKRAPQNKKLLCIKHLDYPGRWTPEEIVLLKQIYPVKSTAEVMRIMHRSRGAIENKAHTYGLEKKNLCHTLFSCQICGKDMKAGKVLPSNFFLICEECVKKQRKAPYMEAAYR